MRYLFDYVGYKKIIYMHITTISLSMLDLIGIAFIFPFLQMLSKPEIINTNTYFKSVNNFLKLNSEYELIYTLCMGALILFFLKMIISIYLNKTLSINLTGISHKLRSNLYSLLMHARYDFFISRSTSELLGMNYAYSSQVVLCLQMWLGIINELFFFSCFLVISLYINPYVTIICTTFIAVVALLIYIFLIKRMMQYGKEQSEIDAAIHRWTHATVSSIKDLKIMGLEEMYSEHTIHLSDKTRNIAWRMGVAISSPRILIEYLSITGFIICSLFFVLAKININEILPTLGLLAVATMRILPAFGRITNYFSGFKYSKNYLDKLQEFRTSLVANTQKIEHQNVKFTKILTLEKINFYFGEKHIIKDLSMEFLKGSSVGIVGASGSGKSTLLDIITGLQQKKSGKFFLDSYEVDPYATDCIRQYVGYVPQQISLIDDTIAFNITFSNEYDTEKVRSILKTANLVDFIDSLEDGIRTCVGESGVRLSGGQKQRIGIARALYRNPQIIIFDESTSSLDNITERELATEIAKLSGSKTIVIVAHRLTTVKNCDLIYVMENGRVVASGTHDQLLENSDVYKNMNYPSKVLMEDNFVLSKS